MPADSSLFHFERMDPIIVCHVKNAAMLDPRQVQDFGNELVKYASSNPGLFLVLNFQRVEYLSSAALSELVRINDAVVAGGGTFKICGVSKKIFEIFKITNLDKHFGINPKESAEAALKRFVRSAQMKAEEERWKGRVDDF